MKQKFLFVMADIMECLTEAGKESLVVCGHGFLAVGLLAGFVFGFNETLNFISLMFK